MSLRQNFSAGGGGVGGEGKGKKTSVSSFHFFFVKCYTIVSKVKYFRTNQYLGLPTVLIKESVLKLSTLIVSGPINLFRTHHEFSFGERNVSLQCYH